MKALKLLHSHTKANGKEPILYCMKNESGRKILIDL